MLHDYETLFIIKNNKEEKHDIIFIEFLALHESQPSQNITDAKTTVRSPKNPSNTALDISRVPAVVPGS